VTVNKADRMAIHNGAVRQGIDPIRVGIEQSNRFAEAIQLKRGGQTANRTFVEFNPQKAVASDGSSCRQNELTWIGIVGDRPAAELNRRRIRVGEFHPVAFGARVELIDSNQGWSRRAVRNAWRTARNARAPV
jgi:hypothetical protein